MSTQLTRLVAKVVVLTAILYSVVLNPGFLGAIGLGAENSLLLDFVHVPGERHPLVTLSGWKVGLVAMLILTYTVVVIAWTRRESSKSSWLLTGSIILAVTSALIGLLNWPALSLVLVDPNRTYTSDYWILRFLADFPGGEIGQRIAAVVLQVLLIVGALKLLGERVSSLRSV